MTGRRREPPGTLCSAAVAGAAWTPERGDLALDTATGRVGVVVAIPEDTGANVYHLRPSRGGADWVARPGTLQPYLDPADGGLDLRAQRLATQSIAMLRAETLAAELYVVHAIAADVHELQSGRAAVSVYCGLLVYTDGTSFRWTSPERSRSGTTLLTSAAQVPLAAELLAENYKVLLSRDGIDVLCSGLPLQGDVLPIHLREVLDAAPV
jgi:hypothetical protein